MHKNIPFFLKLRSIAQYFLLFYIYIKLTLLSNAFVQLGFAGAMLHIDIMGLSKLGCDRIRQEKVYVKFNTFQLDENIPADPFLRF